MNPLRCTCTLGGTNPYCPVDHSRADDRIAEARDGLLADLEWVATTVCELPLLAYSRASVLRGVDGLRDLPIPAVVSGTATLRALMTGDDAALLAAAKAIRAAVEAAAQEKAEDDERDAQDDAAWAA